jgi:hypothetical protein
MRRRSALALAISLFVLAGCSSAGPSPTPTPLPPDTLMLRVESTGGFMPAGMNVMSMPYFSLYADGRAISQGAQIALYPGPALPAIQVTRISPAGVAQILEAAGQVGLSGPDRHLPGPGNIADAGSMVFTVLTPDGRHVTKADALLESSSDDGRDAARRALRAFFDRLTDLRSWLGTEVAAQDEQYTWTSLRLAIWEADPAAAPDQQLVNFQDWPLAAPLATLGQPYEEQTRCAVVSGADAEALRAPLSRANQLTHWRSGGKTFVVLPRPLLPDESGCPAPLV